VVYAILPVYGFLTIAGALSGRCGRIHQDGRLAADRPPHQRLSDRELEVMLLLDSGKTVGQIAELLSLSDKTISTYRTRILEKMHLETTAEIIRYVIENNLIE
jgi:DNA-binding NarL/FixJ family response regulator